MAIDFGRYSSRVCPAEIAVSSIQPGSRVFAGNACATPRNLLKALESLSNTPSDVTILSFLTDGAILLKNGKPFSKYRHKCFFVGREMREAIQLGMAEYIPVSLAQLPVVIKNGRFPIDVAFVQVSAPDRNGYVSLGVSVDISIIAVQHAKRIIAEVNPNMPFTFGDSYMHLSQVDQIVVTDLPVIEYTHPPADDVAQQIACYIAGIIEDESTLQIGLGRIPNAALRYLSNKRDLGIHTDVITDSILDLIESGIVTGLKKTLHPGKIVTSYCMGTKRLYEFVHLNPLFEFRAIDYICDPLIIAKNHKMVSVSQAFAIDLTGQICTDQMEGGFYGGVSTQPDFLRGAALAGSGGKPIICLRSTMEDGKHSNIRPQLNPGEGVGISRENIHFVVTEYGMAYLFGKSIRERALSLIEIANPEFRPWLLDEAKRVGYLPTWQNLKSQKAYLVEEERTVVLNNGKSVRLRPARASDIEAFYDLFHSLSDEDVFTRFFQRIKTMSSNLAQQLCNVNFETEAAFIAVVGERENEKIVGSSGYFLNSTTNIAEVGFMVAHEWQKIGLGSALQNRMKELAISRGIKGFLSEVLNSNKKMIALAQRGSENIEILRHSDYCEITVYF